MNFLLLCGPGSNQRALAHKIVERWQDSGIVVVDPGRNPPAKRSGRIKRIARGIAGLPLRKAWFGMLGRYERLYPGFPTEPLLAVSDVNDPAVAALVRRTRPNLVIVSGTNLLRQDLISAIGEHGLVMNLHTGISPYVRGGPNCTNWCLANRRFDLIGNTVMWIDAGIDSGNLIATAQTPLNGRDNLTQLHIRVMDHAHDLLLRCIQRFADDEPLPNVPQGEIGEGTLYLTRHWNAVAAARAVTNFYLHFPGGKRIRPSPELVG